MTIDKKTLKRIFFGVLGCIVVYWLLHEPELANNFISLMKRTLWPFILGAIMAFILNVPMRCYERLLKGIQKDKLRRAVAMVLTFISAILVITAVFLLLIPQLVDTIASLYPKAYNFFMSMEEKIDRFLADNPQIMEWVSQNTELKNLDWATLVQRVLTIAGNSLTAIFESAMAAIGGIASALMDLFIAIVFCVYALFQKEALARQGRKLVYALLKEGHADYVVKVLRLSNQTFSNFLSGQCIEVCILGTMFAITMAIFRMPFIPLISVLVAVTAFIPVVGAWIGCIVGAFLILISNPLQALWFVVMFLILQQIENNMIYPKVVGTSIGLSGMWVLVAVGVGGELMGVAGMFLMIPVVSVVYTLLREFANKRVAMREIPEEKLLNQPPDLRSRLKEKRERSKAKRLKERLTKAESATESEEK